MENNPDLTHCLNCDSELQLSDNYCPVCGQKRTDGRRSLQQFFADFVDNVFNIDSKFFRTFTRMWVPGQLTLEYFRGKHKSYSHPIRLFLVLSVLFFAVFNLIFDDEKMAVVNFDSEGNYLEQLEELKYHRQYIRQIDTVATELKKNMSHPQAKTALDSLVAAVHRKGPNAPDSIWVNLFGNDSLRLNVVDLATVDEEKLLDKYHIEGFWSRLITRQGIRTFRDQSQITNYFFNNLPLTILLIMPFLALVLKVLYWRRKRYFVEHLIFNFHFHALLFGALIVGLLIQNQSGGEVVAITGIISFLGLYAAMKRYYRQGFFKTFVKYLIFTIAYLFILSFMLLFSLIISFFLF